MIIAVDFDGTIVEHRYPAIGKEIPFAIQTLRQLQSDGHRLILWSVREGRLLQEAVDYCKERGVNFYAVNADFEEEDGSVGGLLDWGTIYALIQKNMGIEEYLIQEGVAQPRKKKSWWPF